jgi:hypothetical protein
VTYLLNSFEELGDEYLKSNSGKSVQEKKLGACSLILYIKEREVCKNFGMGTRMM